MEELCKLICKELVTPLPELSKLGSAEHAATVGDRLYYLESDYPKGIHRLSYIQLSEIQKPVFRTIKDDITKYQPATEGLWIAVVTTTKDDSKRELFLIDPEGNQLGKLISKGIIIERMAWSPDDTKLAYGIMDKSGKGYQICIFDMKTGKNSVIFEGSRMA
jgi:hypothetical protein